MENNNFILNIETGELRQVLFQFGPYLGDCFSLGQHFSCFRMLNFLNQEEAPAPVFYVDN